MTHSKAKPRCQQISGCPTLVTVLGIASLTMMMGCNVWERYSKGPLDTKKSYYHGAGLSIEYPEVAEVQTAPAMAAQASAAPNSLEDPSELPTLDLSLEEAVAMAMRQSPIIRSLNVSVTSGAANSIYDPGLIASSQQGTEAALAAFDAVFDQSLTWNKNDFPVNVPPGFGAFVAGQETAASYQNQLAKRTATGATYSLRHVVNYSRPDNPRLIRSDFVGWVEAEWRQPMMRGAGLQYNRIVGNAQIPGQYSGVLIARINEDTSLADFENAIVGLVSDVEQAYWDLSTAYRLLEANLKGRESALKTYQYQKVRLEVGAGRQDEEAQAQSQYYQFQANVQQQLGGPTGLYALEQQLRYLLGMPATDGRLIRPTTDPTDSKVVFDWNSALSQALERRVEVRRQRFQVKRRELELYAARMNKRPIFDFVGRYRFRGLGDHLIGQSGKPAFDNLYGSITSGNYQEWQAGFEFSLPVGLRQAGVAIANAKLNLQRERAVLAETELRISHDLSNATRNLDITFQLVETNYNRYQSDLRQVEVLLRRYLDGTDNINFLLQAERQVVQSELAFYLALQNYNLSIRDLHRQKGSLLAYNQVQLAEGPWEPGALRDAYERGLFLTPRRPGVSIDMPRPVTRSAFNPSEVQNTSTAVPGQDQIISDAVAPELLMPADGGDNVPVPQPLEETDPDVSPLPAPGGIDIPRL